MISGQVQTQPDPMGALQSKLHSLPHLESGELNCLLPTGHLFEPKLSVWTTQCDKTSASLGSLPLPVFSGKAHRMSTHSSQKGDSRIW